LSKVRRFAQPTGGKGRLTDFEVRDEVLDPLFSAA
jgi:hypothetical protein